MMDKLFSSVRNYDKQSNNPKACKSCGQPATKDVLFEIQDGMMLVERYCNQCAQAAMEAP